jgi:hypothetical protein
LVLMLIAVAAAVVATNKRQDSPDPSEPGTPQAVTCDTVDVLRDMPIILSPTVPVGLRITAAERESILRKVEPLETGMSASLALHVLFAHGMNSSFHNSRLSSSAEVLGLFADDRIGRAYFGRPLMTRTRFGIRPEIHGGQTAVTERHYDQTLGTIAQLGLPLSLPLYVNGEPFTVRDILRDAISSFDLNQGEIEWTVIAYGSYLPPHREWVNKFGERYSFDDLVRELLKRRLDRGSCCGCHILEGMILLERLDRDVAHLLSDDVRHQLNVRLQAILAATISRQASDGSWPGGWYIGLDPPLSAGPESPDSQSLGLRLLATSHLAHTLMYLSNDHDMPTKSILRASQWLLGEIKSADPKFVRENFCPCCHAAWVVCTIAGQTTSGDKLR